MAHKTLKNYIRRNRFLQGEMTQEQFGRKIGLSRQAVSALEKGKTMPSLLLAWRVSKYFKMTIEELFYFEA